MTRAVVITGIGLLTTLGEGAPAHAALLDTAPKITAAPLGAYLVHPLGPVDYDKQIPKKGDQRQMEPWQRTGVYAAGLALSDAGLAGQPELLAETHMIVAAGGGERDEAVDSAVLNGLRTAENKGAYLNERLMNDLRPTLFLAQLSNLLAGNISIVHGVTGSSRTFMGEEMAGVDAIRTLWARIAAGQAELGLVGGAFNASRKDIMLNYAFGDLLLDAPYQPVWSRDERNGGMAMGSMGAFLVLESADHAKARGAKIRAQLSQAMSARCLRANGEMQTSLRRLYEQVAPQLGGGPPAVISCASGVAPVTAQEENFWLNVNKDTALRAVGTVAGHGFEAQAPLACALAALSLEQDRFFAPFEKKEKPLASAAQILVSCCGHWRGEGLMLLEKAAA